VSGCRELHTQANIPMTTATAAVASTTSTIRTATSAAPINNNKSINQRVLRLKIRNDDSDNGDFDRRRDYNKTHPSNNNLFVRLSSIQLVHDLVRLAQDQQSVYGGIVDDDIHSDEDDDDDDDKTRRSQSCWKVPSTDFTSTFDSDSVNFLPLRIEVKLEPSKQNNGHIYDVGTEINDSNKKTNTSLVIYASYNGGLCRCREDQTQGA
jgi:hypothetical protein